MEITNGIKNIIFDWGGVIINIDYLRTKNAFIGMGLKNFEDHYTQFQQKEIFDLLEVGKISGEQFFRELHRHMPNGTSIEQLKDAWNTMLQDFPEENYKLLLDFKDKYRTFLFSNTNEPHLQYYFKKLEQWYGIKEMDPLFEKAYYSCRFGMRKPDPESFRTIIRENDLESSETLFIDDSIQHIEGAREVGLRVYHLVAPERLTDILDV